MVNESPESSPGRPPENGPEGISDEEQRLFHERMRQSGALVDVGFDVDLSTLPPHVTHVRRPDGRIERVGFS
jgi:hypothetical protein